MLIGNIILKTMRVLSNYEKALMIPEIVLQGDSNSSILQFNSVERYST